MESMEFEDTTAKEEGYGDLERSSNQGYSVQDVRDAVDQLRRGMTETTAGMKEAFNRGTDKLYHVITSNNRIVQFRIGIDGRLILEKTVKSLNLHTKKLRDARQKLIDTGKQVPIKAQKQMRQAITGDPNKRIRDHMTEAPQVKMLDKFSFTMGVGTITFTEYLIMRHPEWFLHFYTWFMLFLFLLRFFIYKQAKYHFFMLDFCYLVNLSCMLQAHFFKDNLLWFNANFALSMGPICMAIIVWKNSMVFHSINKLTSFFLHSFPPMLCHLIRWNLIPTGLGIKEYNETMFNIFGPSMGIYIAWQIFYLFCTEVIYKDTLSADRELATSLRYLAKDYKNPLNRVVTTACRSLGIVDTNERLEPESLKTKFIFVSVQLLYTIVMIIPAYFVYMNYYWSCLYLITAYGWGAWNGASYYIEIFSKRYNLKFERKVSTSSEPPYREGLLKQMSNKAIKSDMNKTDTEGRTDDEDDDQYEEALEDMNLNETQAMELIQLLEKLEDEESKRTAITNTRN